MSHVVVDDLLDGPGVDIVKAIRRGLVTRRDVVVASLERAHERNSIVNAVASFDDARAVAAATLADRYDLQRPLEGVPCTIKDTIETAGLRTTAGSRRFVDYVPSEDAPSVRRVRAAGAVVCGKSNVPSLAGDIDTTNDLFGRTENPWRPGRTAGGSSGGSAAAVASGLSTFDIGSDFAGSLRVPAAYCGVYAHRPTEGVVPTLGHIPPWPGAQTERDLVAIGPVARDPRDLAIVLRAIAGSRRTTPGGWDLTLAERVRDDGHWSVAVTVCDSHFTTAHDVRCAIEDLASELVRLGVRVVEAVLPVSLSEVFECFARLLGAAVSISLDDERFALTRDYADELDDRYARRDALAVTQTHREWLQLLEWRAELARAFDHFLCDVDVWLSPVTQTVAPPVFDAGTDRYARRIMVDNEEHPYFEQLAWTAPAAVARLPATTAPIGVIEGLPTSVQVISRSFNDYVTLEFADTLRAITGSFRHPTR